MSKYIEYKNNKYKMYDSVIEYKAEAKLNILKKSADILTLLMNAGVNTGGALTDDNINAQGIVDKEGVERGNVSRAEFENLYANVKVGENLVTFRMKSQGAEKPYKYFNGKNTLHDWYRTSTLNPYYTVKYGNTTGGYSLSVDEYSFIEVFLIDKGCPISPSCLFNTVPCGPLVDEIISSDRIDAWDPTDAVYCDDSYVVHECEIGVCLLSKYVKTESIPLTKEIRDIVEGMIGYKIREECIDQLLVYHVTPVGVTMPKFGLRTSNLFK